MKNEDVQREVILAKSAGFCFGVQRAVDTVYEQAEKNDGPIYTYGPIIHNEEVVCDLAARGIGVIHSEEELARLNEGTIVIRSHGVPERIYRLIREQGLELVDATCPFVKKIRRIVQEHSQNGMHIVIIGDDRHPEVEGIKGWVKSSVSVIETEEQAREWTVDPSVSVCIVSQTTFNNNKFKDLVEIISKKSYNVICVNTICNATGERQTEAAQIAEKADAMIVIGGKSSSNTQKLYEICRSRCNKTVYIQTAADLTDSDILESRRIGITAGASTPKKIIEEVQKNVRNGF